MSEITMPRLSDSMQEGTILAWLKRDGEHVDAGEDLIEIETDKATMTYEAPTSGTVSIVANEGSTLLVGTVIARIGDVPTASEPMAVEASAVVDRIDTSMASPSNGARTIATPLARRVATVHGVSLEGVVGSGPRGRITRRDVLLKAGHPLEPAAIRDQKPAAASHNASAAQTQADDVARGDVDRVELSRLQTTVARRMAEAKATVPHFQVQTEVTMDAALAFREQLKSTGGPVPSINDLIVKAAALALRRHPRANGAYRDGAFELYARINVGIAVAAEDALVVPTLFDADQQSLGAIATESRRLAGLVRDGRITPRELPGATFTVSNLGMYGMTAIFPVINPPQAAILGVGAARAVLTRHGGEIVEQQLLTLTLTCDHRILYGADAAQLLSEIRGLIEQPLRLAL
jgi:pyruvate dehydrogenase E2 component (dihydrolipoamide acetyltransferase)